MQDSRNPLQTFEVALEIYLIIHSTPSVCYTCSQISKLIEDIHKIYVKPHRVRQICDALSNRNRIKKTVKPHPGIIRKTTAYQATSKPTELYNGPRYQVAQIIAEMSNYA